VAANVLSQNVVQRITRNVAVSSNLVRPETREALLGALDAEYAAARQMTDDVFWGYDSAWLGLGAPELVDGRRAGAGGGGGANMSWNNNQFWRLAQQCDRGLFTLVMYQQRRYMAAQIRIARHLANVPQIEVLQGFDRMASSNNVRAACMGVEVKTKAREWAYWCEEAVRLIGAARWASNFTWSDTSRTCGDSTYRLDAQPIVGPYDPGCRYRPDCSSDRFGVPRLGYVAGKSPNGIARWEAIAKMAPQTRANIVDAARSWEIRQASPVLPFGYTGVGSADAGNPWPISISPYVLGLHQSSRSWALGQIIPQGSQAFNGRWGSNAVHPDGSPRFLRRAASADPTMGDLLFAYFLEIPENNEAYLAQKALRDETGNFYWKYAPSGGGASGVATSLAHPVPGSEMIIWWLVALMRDIAAMPFGQVVIDGFANLDRAVQGIPVELRGNLDEIASRVRSAAAAVRQEQAAIIGGAFTAVAGGAAAINPIAGLIVGLIGSLATALVAFSLDIGLARGSNPPALQAPALRVAPTSLTGDDRCLVNPGELETLASYQTRVTTPYAEAARASGGDAGAMFDLIPQVRTAQYCAQNPTDPRCQAAAAPGPSWPKWLAGAGGTAAGVALIKVLGG
jgi:hypothetical protein